MVRFGKAGRVPAWHTLIGITLAAIGSGFLQKAKPVSQFRTPPQALAWAVDVGLSLSVRLQMVAVTLLLLLSLQLVAASCTPEPVPYASRVSITR